MDAIFLGLGTNVGNRLQNLRTALQKIKQISQLSVIGVSPIYESDALLPNNADTSWNQPYLNMAISCKTSLTPHDLKKKVKSIEQEMGRPANYPHWSPRLIDIDLLAWGDDFIQNDELHIPHKDLHLRPFAMWPLADLNPKWIYCAPNNDCFGKTAKEIVDPWGSRFDGKAPLHTKQIPHRIDFPQLAGVLNITPDSYSDGGKFITIDAAVKHAEYLHANGAEIIDIGAESTNPAKPKMLNSDEEWQRLGPALKEILQIWPDKLTRPIISIDTRHHAIAEKVIAMGVDWINDVTGFDDPNMLNVVKQAPVKLLCMHSLSIPACNKGLVLPLSSDPIAEMVAWTNKKLIQFEQAGISRNRIIIDPGIGFGKTAEQSFNIIKRAAELRQIVATPILIGHSRKSFLTQFTSQPAAERDLETVVVSNYLAEKQVDYLRVHDVESHARSFKIAAALRN